METDICFATLSTGTKVKLNREAYNQFCEAEKDDYIQLEGGRSFKKSAVMEIQDINEWVDDKSFNYGQPYTALYEGQDRGYKGIIDLATDVSHIEAMVRGLNKAKARFNKSTPQIDEFLKKAGEKFMKIKSGAYANK